MRTTRWILAGFLAAWSFSALAAEATLHREKSFAAKPGGMVRVEASFHDIGVQVRQGATVEVKVDLKASTWPGDAEEFVKSCEPQFSEEGNTILVRCKPSFHMTIGYQNVDAKIVVDLPPGMDLDLSTGSGDIEVKGDTSGRSAVCSTGSGDVALDAGAAKFSVRTGSGGVRARLSPAAAEAEVETGSGDVKIEGGVAALKAHTGSGGIAVHLSSPAKSVRLRSSSGDVELSGGAEEADVHTSSGEVRLSGLTGKADLGSSSGDVAARWVKLSSGDEVRVRTSSGSVRLELPPGVSPSGTLDTGSGKIAADSPGTFNRRHSTCELAGRPGAPRIDVETGSGDITLRTRT
jgi:DUF4097 and DUF4098 domain-containing protein YvlB